MKIILLASILALGVVALQGSGDQAGDNKAVLINIVQGQIDNNADKLAQETADFKEFKGQSDALITKLENQVERNSMEVERLTSEAAEAEASSVEAARKIKETQKAIDEVSANKKANQDELREKQRAHNAKDRDFEESVNALGRAIDTLKAQPSSTAQSFVQVMPLIPEDKKHMVVSLLEQPNPEAAGFENQSGGVVNMLKGLKSKFQEEQFASKKEFIGVKNNLQLLIQSDQDLLEKHGDAKAALTEQKTSYDGEAGENRREAGETSAELAQNKKDLAEAQDTWAKELSRYTKVKNDLETENANLTTALKQVNESFKLFLQFETAHREAKEELSFLQHQSVFHVKTDQEKIDILTQMLNKDADSLQSKSLSLVAARLETMNPQARAGVAGPLAKIVGMIRDMIQKMKDEAGADIAKHAFCTENLARNKQVRDSLTQQINGSQNTIAQKNARAGKLQEEVSRSMEAKADVEKELDHQTQRTKKKEARFEKLEAFASKTIEGMETAKKMFGAAMGGSASSNKKAAATSDMIMGLISNVCNFLEGKRADFESRRKEMLMSFDDAQAKMNTSIAVHKQNLADTNYALDITTKESSEENNTLASLVQQKSEATDKFDALKPQCVETGLSYGERVAKRAAEIQSLKECVKVLEEV